MPRKTTTTPNSAWVRYSGCPAPGRNAKQTFIFGRSMSTVAVHDGLCYAAELDGYLHCLDAKTGQKYWTYDTKRAMWGSPYWVDGKVYLGTEDGDLFVFKHDT